MPEEINDGLTSFKKEYYSLCSKKIPIGIVMMVKNEKKRLHVSLESVKTIADAIIIYDTGSTDNTVEILKEFCEKNKINLYIKFGTFVNFSDSRNVLLEFADTIDVKFLLQLDCNDELKNPNKFLEFIKIANNAENTGFLLCQVWFHGGGTDKYWNIRLVKNKSNWRYFGAVHEYMKDTTVLKKGMKEKQSFKCGDEFYLYQDRTQDDDKTSKRFVRDKEMLIASLEKNPNDTRAIFYLAQTYSCLNDFRESYNLYEKRSTMQGYLEENFISCMRCGEYNLKLGGEWEKSFIWFMKAYELFERVEPLIRIIEYYIATRNYRLAYFFSTKAMGLSYPYNCNLFVNKHDYDYTRYHLHGICAFYVGDFDGGSKACLHALKEKNLNIDRINYNFYLEQIKFLQKQNKSSLQNVMFGK